MINGSFEERNVQRKASYFKVDVNTHVSTFCVCFHVLYVRGHCEYDRSGSLFVYTYVYIYIYTHTHVNVDINTHDFSFSVWMHMYLINRCGRIRNSSDLMSRHVENHEREREREREKEKEREKER